MRRAPAGAQRCAERARDRRRGRRVFERVLKDGGVVRRRLQRHVRRACRADLEPHDAATASAVGDGSIPSHACRVGRIARQDRRGRSPRRRARPAGASCTHHEQRGLPVPAALPPSGSAAETRGATIRPAAASSARTCPDRSGEVRRAGRRMVMPESQRRQIRRLEARRACPGGRRRRQKPEDGGSALPQAGQVRTGQCRRVRPGSRGTCPRAGVAAVQGGQTGTDSHSGSGPMGSVDVVIPTWNGRALLDRCLDTLARQTVPRT